MHQESPPGNNFLDVDPPRRPWQRKKFPFKKCHEGHQTDQRNVLNTKMHLVGGQNFFQWSKLAKIGRLDLVIVISSSGGGGGGSTHYIHPCRGEDGGVAVQSSTKPTPEGGPCVVYW